MRCCGSSVGCRQLKSRNQNRTDQQRPNKALHPTAYSFVRSSLRFRRRVSLVVVLLRLRDGNRVWSTPVVDMLLRCLRVLVSVFLRLKVFCSRAALWAFGRAAFLLPRGFWLSAAEAFRLCSKCLQGAAGGGSNVITAAQQGAAPDRLQLRLCARASLQAYASGGG